MIIRVAQSSERTQRTRRVVWPWLTLFFFLSGCTDQRPEALRIGVSFWPPNELAYLAQEEGFFADHNIELIEFGSPAEYLPSYAAGGFDAAIVTLGSALELVSLDSGHRVVLLLDYSAGGDALVVRSGIDTSSEEGELRVGYEAIALGAYLLHRFAELNNLPMERIEPIPIDVLDHEQAFYSGQIDAVVTMEPIVSNLLSSGARVMSDSRAIPEEIMDVLVVHESALRDKRSQIVAFAEGWFAALEIHNADINAAAHRAELRQHVSADSYLQAFERVVLLSLEENRQRFSSKRGALIEVLDRHRVFLQEAQFTDPQISSDTILDDTIVKSIR